MILSPTALPAAQQAVWIHPGGRIGTPDRSDDGVLDVASLDDLLALKLSVLLQRVEIKDYQDIVAMLKSGMSLERGLGGAQALYGGQFQPSEALKALTYFKDADFHALTQPYRELLVQSAVSVGTIPAIGLAATTLHFPRNDAHDLER